MSNAGRPRTPAAIRIAEGNPGKRPINHRELDGETIAPECPEWLDEEAAVHWDRLAAVLVDLGVARPADQVVMGSVCIALSALIEARQMFAELPRGQRMLTRTPTGAFQESPLVKVINRQIELLNSLGAQLGLTPASRARLLTDDAPPQRGQSLEDILSAAEDEALGISVPN